MTAIMRTLALAAFALAAFALALGCDGTTGTITLRVVGPRDPALLESVVRLRATLGDEVVEAVRDADGRLAIDLEVVADGDFAAVLLEGFDAGDARVAVGRTPPLPIAAIEAEVAIFMGPPGQLAVIEPTLAPARSDLGVAAIDFGVLIAGGSDDVGAVADVSIYDVYRHDLVPGLPMPAPRSGILAMSSPGSPFVYLFGGLGADGFASDLWRFDTTASPAGEYYPIPIEPLSEGHASGPFGDDAVAVAPELFLVGGQPALAIHGAAGTITELSTDIGLGARLAPIGDGAAIAAGSNEDGAVVRLAYDGATGAIVDTVTRAVSLSIYRRWSHAIVPVGDHAVVLGGTIEDAPALVDVEIAADGTVTDRGELLQTWRQQASAASNGEHILVVGGLDADSQSVATAEILTTDLEQVAVIDALPRFRAHAVPLANGQILVLGGYGPDNEPVAELELWTPDY
jgi:hypothetical protein